MSLETNSWKKNPKNKVHIQYISGKFHSFKPAQLDKCGWNPTLGFDGVLSDVDISSLAAQLLFSQLGHYKSN